MSHGNTTLGLLYPVSSQRSTHMTHLLRLVVLALVFTSPSAWAGCATSGDIDISQLAAKVTSISFSADPRGNTITTFGIIKNASPLCAQDIVVEVKYFDAQGAQVDVTTQTLGLSLASQQETAFRVRDDADKPREVYATSAIRVISVEPLFGRTSRGDSSWWFDLLCGWGPTLLFICLVAFLLRRTLGKNSPQRQSLAMVQHQQETLERIAAALEKRVAP